MHPDVFLRYRQLVEEKAILALQKREDPYKGLTKLETAFMDAHLKRKLNARIGKTYKIKEAVS